MEYEKDRDWYEDMATSLAEAIAEHFGADIEEQDNMADLMENALYWISPSTPEKRLDGFYCWPCGQRVENWSYCPNCGKKLDWRSEE